MYSGRKLGSQLSACRFEVRGFTYSQHPFGAEADTLGAGGWLL